MPRVQKLCILALCVTFIFVLADIPFLAEYMFARGITRWLTALVGSITNFLPASLYECAAVLLIAGGVVLAAGLIVLLAKKSYARAARWLYRLAVAVLAVLLAFGLMYAPLYERKSAVSALGLTEISADEESVFLAAQYYIGELNALSEKLEMINLQFARRKAVRKAILHWLLIAVCAGILIVSAVLAAVNSPYLGWDLSDPELAVAGTVFHAFEWFFVRLAPLILIAAIVGVCLTRKKA